MSTAPHNSPAPTPSRHSIEIAGVVLLLLALFVSGAKADFIVKCMVETSGQRFEETIKQTDTKRRADFSEFSVIGLNPTTLSPAAK
jgi:hypothetical protein